MECYDQNWRELNRELRAVESDSGNLRAVFARLHKHQVESGFIRGDLDNIQRFCFCHPEVDSRCLRVQYNPDRAARFHGAGIQAPPDAEAIRHGGCFLCRDNIEWQQQGRQVGYEVEVNANPYIAWMNPFPLLPAHVVLATRGHVTQEWDLHPGGQLPPARIIADLVRLAARAPGYAGVYNGVDAGASIPDHMHYQLFRPPPDHRRFPLEVEATAVRGAMPGQECWHLGHYPLDVVHWHGLPDEIIEQSCNWMSRWAAHQDNLPELSANVLTISEEEGDEVSLFFVPRNRKLRRASWLSGIVGGLEVLGELVISSPAEKHLLDSGKLDYFNLEKLLAAVCSPLIVP